jgi:chromosome segregation ATPase
LEKDNVVNQLSSAVSELTAAREHAATLTTRIDQFESSYDSLTLQRDDAISRATELLAGIDNKDRVLTSLTSERDELVLSAEECKGLIALLEAEKVGAVSKVAGLKDTVDGLQRQTESLSAKLRAADSKDECARTQVANLTSQVSGLTAEREQLATKLEEATSELSELQSAFESVRAERDGAQGRVRELLSGDTHTKQIVEVLNSEKNGLTTQIEECIKRLYAENEESPLEPNTSNKGSRWGARKSPIADLHAPCSSKSNGSPSPIERLEEQLRDKDVQMSKLMKDKEKLEAYTKQTLLIFQQKYFSTTQDFKAQLKTKSQQIHSLETELRGR